MQQLKQTHAQCEKLNQAAACAEPGKKQYAVINSKIMEKDVNGKLKICNYPTVTNQPKNDWGAMWLPCIRSLVCGSSEGGG